MNLRYRKQIADKHVEWMNKLATTIDEENIPNIPNDCRWLRYWNKKALSEIPELYLELEVSTRSLLKKAAEKMSEANQKTLEKAEKHGIGSKVRNRYLTGYLYTYVHHIHPLFIETEAIEETKEISRQFLEKHFNELYETYNKLDEFQLQNTIRFLYAAKSVMHPIPDHLLNRFQERKDTIRAPPKPHVTLLFLNLARQYLEQDKHIHAGIQVCEGLTCILYIIGSHYQSEIDPYTQNFEEPHTTDTDHWIRILKARNIISTDQLVSFSQTISKWHTKIGSQDYVQPTRKELEAMIEETQQFCQQQINKIRKSESQ